MISVVLTTYNGEKYIIEQLDSIINQTLKPNEILISDDNSTDNTLLLIFDYCNKHSIKYFVNDEVYNTDIKINDLYIRIFTSNNNIGFNKNFLNTIKKSSNNIIFLSDQDDIWYKNKIKLEYDLINIKKAVCVASNYDLEYKENNLNIISYKLVYLKDMYNVSFYGMTMCFRKDDLLNRFINFLNENTNFLYYDRLLTLFFVLNDKTYFINDSLVYHRIHNKNAVGNNTLLIRGSIFDRVIVSKDYYNDILLIEKFLKDNNIIINDKNTFENIKEFRFNRYNLLNSLSNKNSFKNKIKLFVFIISNIFKYPYIKSVFGDLYYIFR